MPDELSPELLAAIDRAAQYDPSITGHVMRILDLATRPSKAIWSGVKGGMDDTGILSGAYKGLMGESDTELADVLGMEKGQAEEDWPTWLSKEIPRFGANVAGDPLTYLFSPVKAGAGIVPRVLAGAGISEGKSLAARAAKPMSDPIKNYLSGTGWARLLMERPPDTDLFRGANEIMDRVKWETSLYPEHKQIVEAKNAHLKKLKEMGIENPADLERVNKEVYHALERPGEMSHEIEALAEIARPVQNLMDETTRNLNKSLVAAGKPEIAMLQSDYGRMMPHSFTALAAKRAGFTPTKGRIGDPNLTDEARKIWTFVDEEGTPVVSGALNHPNTKVVKRGDEYFYVGDLPKDMKIKSLSGEDLAFAGAQKVTKEMADLKTVMGVSPYTSWPGVMVTDPYAAMLKKITKRKEQERFIKTLTELEAAGKIRKYDWAVEEGGPALGVSLPRGERFMNVKGFEEYVGPKGLVNHLENQARSAFEAGVQGDLLGDLVQRLAESRAGQSLGKLTDVWKRFTLAHPGWAIPNIVSNLGQMYLAPEGAGGISALGKMGKAARLQYEKGPLYEEFMRRGFGEGLYGELKDVGLTRAIEGPGFIERTLGPTVDKAASTAGKVGLDTMFWVGSKGEQNAKLSVALNWIEKNAPDFEKLSDVEKASVLDRAARAAHTALIDYGAGTPFEKNLAKIAIPFLAWQRGILGRTLDVAATEPQKLGRMSRFLDTTFTPMSEADKQIADPWMKEQSPVTGALGRSLGVNEAGLPNMLMLGRFLPHMNIEQLTSRPGEQLLSTVSPFVKAPYELIANKNLFKGRDIDPIAGGFPANLVNPLLDRPYALATNKPFGQALPGAYDYILSLAPGARHANELSEAGRALGLWNDEYRQPFGQYEYPVWLATGGKFYPFDATKARTNREREANQAERQIKWNMTYSARKGDYAAVDFYTRQLADARNRRRGVSTVESTD